MVVNTPIAVPLIHLSVLILVVKLFLVSFFETGSSHYVDKAGFEPTRDPPASAFQGLG